MGVKGLLPFVEKACRQGNISEFHGKTIAVDISCLLHRSFTACVYEVAHGQRSDMYIKFIRRYIDALLNEDCHVILVYDGRPLPAKENTNVRRSQIREHNLKLGQMFMESKEISQAHKHFQMSASITPDIVEHTIEEFRGIEKVDILVAPYEADPQLTFLVKSGIADAVLTEDSDLIPFGCETIIFKFNLDGNCTIYEKKFLHKCLNSRLSSNFSFDIFRRMCIMAGCDYFPEGVPKVGLKKAMDVFVKSSHANDFSMLVSLLKKVPRYLELTNVLITDKVVKSFIEAEFTFLHQIVYDPIKQCQVPLNDYFDVPKEIEKYLVIKYDKFWYAGKALSKESAFRLAIGNLNLKVADKFSLHDPPLWSIYHPDFFKSLEAKKNDQPSNATPPIAKKETATLMTRNQVAATQPMAKNEAITTPLITKSQISAKRPSMDRKEATATPLMAKNESTITPLMAKNKVTDTPIMAKNEATFTPLMAKNETTSTSLMSRNQIAATQPMVKNEATPLVTRNEASDDSDNEIVPASDDENEEFVRSGETRFTPLLRLVEQRRAAQRAKEIEEFNKHGFSFNDFLK